MCGMPKLASLRSKVLLAISSILLLLVGMEGFVRGVLRVSPIVERFRLSHTLGWEWTPGYDAVESFHGVKYRMRISSQGLRNEEIVTPKPAGNFRILAIGDSVTEGPGVELNQTFVKLVQQTLQADAPRGRTIEVINAGTGDYGLQQEVVWLRTRGLKYEPDLVLVGLYLNDSRSFGTRPAPVVFFNNLLVSKCAFYHFYRNAVRARAVDQAEAAPDFRFRYIPAWRARAWIKDARAIEALIQAADQDWGLAWNRQELARLEAGLTEMMQMAQAHSFGLFVALFPTDVQVYAQAEIPQGLDWPQRNLLAFARRQDLPALDLLPLLRDHQSEDLFYDLAHLRPVGHQLAATALANALREHQLVPQLQE
jgi:lysophospholipase L1-like esterase